MKEIVEVVQIRTQERVQNRTMQIVQVVHNRSRDGEDRTESSSESLNKWQTHMSSQQ